MAIGLFDKSHARAGKEICEYLICLSPLALLALKMVVGAGMTAITAGAFPMAIAALVFCSMVFLVTIIAYLRISYIENADTESVDPTIEVSKNLSEESIQPEAVPKYGRFFQDAFQRLTNATPITKEEHVELNWMATNYDSFS